MTESFFGFSPKSRFAMRLRFARAVANRQFTMAVLWDGQVVRLNFSSRRMDEREMVDSNGSVWCRHERRESGPAVVDVYARETRWALFRNKRWEDLVTVARIQWDGKWSRSVDYCVGETGIVLPVVRRALPDLIGIHPDGALLWTYLRGGAWIRPRGPQQ